MMQAAGGLLEVQKNHSWNTAMLILNALIFHVGLTILEPSFIVVAYLKHFTNNAVLLNLPVFVVMFGMGMGPLAASFFSYRYKRKKFALIFFSLVEKIFLIPFLLAVYLFSGRAKVIIPVFFVGFVCYNVAWGFSWFFWQEMLGRVLVPERRASALGLRDAFAKAAGLAGSVLSVCLLKWFAFPLNFFACFLVSLGSLSVSIIFYFFIREASWSPSARAPRTRYLRNLLLLPKTDSDFKWFIVFILFASGSVFVGGLYTSVGIDRFGAEWGSDQLAGIFIVVTSVSAIVMAPFVGRIHDRFGRFWGFLPGVLFSVLEPLAAIFAQRLPMYLLVFALRGMAMSRWYLEPSTVLGFADPGKQHPYIAYLGFIKVLPILIYTYSGGVLANMLSPNVTFGFAFFFCLISLLILACVLRPRWSERKIAVKLEFPDLKNKRRKDKTR